ncbi:MAG: ArnT family glycosyltransferase [Labedaea sp.]
MALAVKAVALVRRNRASSWALALVVAVWLVANAWWILAYRHRQLLDIDEAGYIGMALNDYYAAGRDGLLGWLKAFDAPGIQAPLTSAVTSVAFLVTGPRVLAAFVIPVLAGLATILLTYGLARRIGGPRLAWPALLLVATAPGLLVESRAFHFALPAAAVTTGALYCLVRSDRFTRTGFALAFGVCLGLMPLTRTMTISFLPGLLLAAILQASIGPDRRQRLARCAAAVAAAVAVAALWLAPNGVLVFRYLGGFGYGTQSREYGHESGLANPAAWLERLRILIGDQHLPHVLVIGVGLIAATVFVVGNGRTAGFREVTRRVALSPLLPSCLLVLTGHAALLSSANTGTAFALPLFPAMTVIAVWGLLRLPAAVLRAVPAVLAVLLVVAVVPMLDLRAPTAHPLLVQLPVVGSVKVTDGRGAIQLYEREGTGTDDLEPVSVDTAQQWIAASDWAAKRIVEQDALRGTTAFGFRDRLFNSNTAQLVIMQSKGYGVRMAMINPTEVGGRQENYEDWLTKSRDSLNGDASHACLLFTATGTVNEFVPAVDPPAMEQAAHATGFAVLDRHPLPNGRVLTLWRRTEPDCG